MVQADRRDRHPDRGRRPDGDQPQAHPDGRRQESLQLPPSQSQPDWIRHRINRRSQSSKSKRYFTRFIKNDLNLHAIPGLDSTYFFTK